MFGCGLAEALNRIGWVNVRFSSARGFNGLSAGINAVSYIKRIGGFMIILGAPGWALFGMAASLALGTYLLFKLAEKAVIGCSDPVSPLVLDLDGDGVEADGWTAFDHSGDGFAELGNWASEDDGVLVIDLDEDGEITSGAELFGSNTLVSGRLADNGFDALAAIDSNSDGVIDSSDTDWGKLRVYRWTDANDNGFFDEGEGRLETLAQHGITSLGLSYEASTHVDESGNEHRQIGSYVGSGGVSRALVDVWFQTEPALSRNIGSDIPEHSETISTLPDASGGGLVHRLRDAMALDGEGNLTPPFYGEARSETRTLEQLVQAFKDATDSASRDELADKILLRWAGAEGAVVSDYWRGEGFAYTTPQKLAVVEAFQGGQWREGEDYRHPASVTARKINRLYFVLLERLRADMLSQIGFSDMFDSISLTLNGEEVTDETDLSDVNPSSVALDFSGVSAVEGASSRISEFLRTLAALYPPTEGVQTALEAVSSEWAYEYRYHGSLLGGMVSDGLAQIPNLYMGDGGSDTFRSTDGGSDVLAGLGGSDTYQLGPGTGHDVIDEDRLGQNGGGEATDVVMVAPGVARANVLLSRDGYDLVIGIKGSDGAVADSLRVRNHYSNEDAEIERVELSDGTVYVAEDFAEVSLSSGVGTSGSDSFDASLAVAAVVQQGGAGSDTYLLGRGSGEAAVDEHHLNQGGGSTGDAIRLKPGLGLTDVKLTRSGADLVVGLVVTNGAVSDSLTVKGQFLHGSARVERLESSDGTLLLDLETAQAGLALLNGSAGGVIEGIGGGVADTFGSDGGTDTFRGRSGDDVYVLDAGSGTDFVEEGHGNRVAGDGGDAVRMGAGITSSDVRLRRTMWDLVVELLDDDGDVSDTLTVRDQYRHNWAGVEKVVLDDGTVLWDADAIAALTHSGPTYTAGTLIRGTASGDYLYGSDTVSDVFDSDAGGNDRLYGGSGDDEYRLGSGTGFDVIREDYTAGGSVRSGTGDAGDAIAIESGYGVGDVVLRRDHDHLWVELLGVANAQGVRSVTDSLQVHNHFAKGVAQVEAVGFSDGTVWGSAQFHAVAIRGGTGKDYLYGRDDTADIFDADGGGNDRLYGGVGDDDYRLGSGTGFDVIREDYTAGGSVRSVPGDAGDAIVIESGHGVGDVVLRRDHEHLWVELLGASDAQGVRSVTDSLQVYNYFAKDLAKVEAVRFSDGTEWGSAEFHAVAIRGGTRGDYLYGRADLADKFDADAGGNDRLYGGAGDDEYRLGSGTGFDEIREGYTAGGRVRAGTGDAGDVIVIESGYGVDDVVLRRDREHLWVELLGVADDQGARSVTDSLQVHHYFEQDLAKVEAVEFSDGTAWGSAEFHAVAIRGGLRNDYLYGRDDLSDIFDSDAGGNDRLYGGAGDDEYRLGSGTGFDVIREDYTAGGSVRSGTGDAGDVIVIESSHGVDDVVLRRDHEHLWVELLGVADGQGVRPVSGSLQVYDYFEKDLAKVETVEFSDGTVWDWDDFHAVAIRGGSRNDYLYGRDDLADIFDSDAGGNDRLYGGAGNDEYRLGGGTGFDAIREDYTAGGSVRRGDGDSGDKIVIESGYGVDDVVLRRDHEHLWVELLGPAGDDGSRLVTDSLQVHSYFGSDLAKVESVAFSDGTEWGSAEFHAVAIRGGSRNDYLYGRDDLADIFDSDAGGNDRLYGGAGDDEYRLGGGTGFDVIREDYTAGGSVRRGDGDSGDKIVIESGYGVDDVVLRRDHEHLWVELLGPAGDDGSRSVSDSLQVHSYFGSDLAKVESVVFSDGTEWGSAEFHAVAIRGGSRNDYLYGRDDLADNFDADAGGNDRLYGGAGDDEYSLGSGTGFDVIREDYTAGGSVRTGAGDSGDAVAIESGFGVSDVVLRRDHEHLWVELLGPAGDDGARSVTDSLQVHSYFGSDLAKVESVVFSDGTEWGSAEFHAVAIRGGARGDYLYGRDDLADIFDSDAGGNDWLYGGAGDDEYRLGLGTGYDTIHEGYTAGGSVRTGTGDSGDVIAIESGFGVEDVVLRSDGRHLWVELLGTANGQGLRAVTDSLKVADYFRNDLAKVETVEFSDGTEWGGKFVVGTASGDTLTSTAASETLYGGAGNDVYVFSGEFGDDRVVDSGGTDTVRVSGHATTGLSFEFDGDDVVMSEVGGTSSVRFENWRSGGDARSVERVEADGYVLVAAQIERIAIRSAAFVEGGGTVSSFLSQNHLDYWTAIPGSPGS